MLRCAFLILLLLLSDRAAFAQHRKERITALGQSLHLYDSQVEPGTGNIVSIGYEVRSSGTYPLLLKTDGK